MLNNGQKDGIYHYTHYEEGIRMNKYLGGDSEIVLSDEELSNLANTQDALSKSSLPYDTVLWRGTESWLLDGFDDLPHSIKDWKRGRLSYKGFSSTSIIRDASYINSPNKDVQLILVKRGNQNGAVYVEEISYNHFNNLKSEQEVLLQNSAEFSIIEAQRFKGKTIIVAEVL